MTGIVPAPPDNTITIPRATWNQFGSNMLRVVVVFGRVAGLLPLKINGVLFDVGRKNIVRAHAEDLRH